MHPSSPSGRLTIALEILIKTFGTMTKTAKRNLILSNGSSMQESAGMRPASAARSWNYAQWIASTDGADQLLVQTRSSTIRSKRSTLAQSGQP